MRPTRLPLDRLISKTQNNETIVPKEYSKTYRRRQDDQENSNNDPSHTKQKANQPHTRPSAPWQPYTRHQRRNHLYHQNNNGLRRPTPLPTPNSNPKRQIRSKQQTREHL